MENNNKTLLINISNKSKTKEFKYSYTKEIRIEDIKDLCNKNFYNQKKDLNNIILSFVDEDGDTNIINNFDELINFSKKVDENNFSINIFCEERKEKNNNINAPHKENKINNNKGNIIKDDNKNDINDIICTKDKEIEDLKNEIYNLKKKNEYDFERYKNLLFYYQEFIKQDINEKEKKDNDINKIENNKNGNNIKNKENEKIENKVNEKEINKNEEQNIIKNNENEKKEENNNKINIEFKENKNEKRNKYDLEIPNQNIDLQMAKTFNYKKAKWDFIDDKIQIDTNLNKKGQINLKYIEFINERCFLCKHRSENKIYKDYIEKKSYLCENCYNKNKKIYKDKYFEIKFPKELLDIIMERKLKRKELGNKPIIDFNNFLNNIFFDNKGNLSTKEIIEINDKDFSELKKIYNNMILISEDPVKYFADYQISFINKPKLKLNDNEKNVVEKKLALFLDNLTKLLN